MQILDSEYGEIFDTKDEYLFDVFLFDLSFVDLLNAVRDVVVKEYFKIGRKDDVVFHIGQRFV
jgi:hypothetical protein